MLDLNDMNESQRKAVTYGEGPLLLLAGPGSGKTFTITRRILYLLERGVPPEQILVITFTREAAESMQSRFQRMSSGFSPVNFGTFHSIFYHILQKSKTIKSTELFSNTEKKNLIIPIMKTCGEISSSDLSWESLREDASSLLAAISYYKNTLCLQKAAGKVPTQWREHFSQILEEYDRAVLVCGRLDFDDMLCRCRQLLLQDASFRREWQGRFLHILIDEFQDTNPVQYETIKLLAGEGCSIFAVGDDDQSIYGFRGSEPECLKRFQREYGADKLLLDINYRSHPEIVRASLAVISENRDRYEKRLRPASERGELSKQERVQLLSFRGKEEQYAYLIKRLEDFAKKNSGDSKAECAVLFRTNSRMQGLAVRLRSEGIPYIMGERMQSIYEHFIAKDITAYLRLASGEWSRELLLRVVNRPSRYVSREAIGSGARTIEELIAYYKKTDFPERRQVEVLKHLKSFERQLNALSSLSPGLGVAYVQKASGYERYLLNLAGGNQERLVQWRETLEWLREDAGRFSNVKDWCAAQEAHTKSLERQVRGSGQKGGPEGGQKAVIRLMTVHGAKGLEFDTVILPNCNEGIYPHGRLQGEAEVEEERRVFYVAMTRAKENLELLYLTGEEERSRPPSRFLKPLS